MQRNELDGCKRIILWPLGYIYIYREIDGWIGCLYMKRMHPIRKDAIFCIHPARPVNNINEWHARGRCFFFGFILFYLFYEVDRLCVYGCRGGIRPLGAKAPSQLLLHRVHSSGKQTSGICHPPPHGGWLSFKRSHFTSIAIYSIFLRSLSQQIIRHSGEKIMIRIRRALKLKFNSIQRVKNQSVKVNDQRYIYRVYRE